jgi:hypothetical protein
MERNLRTDFADSDRRLRPGPESRRTAVLLTGVNHVLAPLTNALITV